MTSPVIDKTGGRFLRVQLVGMHCLWLCNTACQTTTQQVTFHKTLVILYMYTQNVISILRFENKNTIFFMMFEQMWFRISCKVIHVYGIGA
jgi:hypothetical protein